MGEIRTWWGLYTKTAYIRSGCTVHKKRTDTEGRDKGPIDTEGATHGGSSIHPEPRATKLLPISMHFCRTYF